MAFHLDEQIERLFNQDNTDEEKVDSLLELDRDVRDIGSNHTKTEKKESRAKSTKIYKAIQKIDPETGGLLLKAKDK